jgi:hypothetical protein
MKTGLFAAFLTGVCFCGYTRAQVAPPDFLGITPEVRRSLTRTGPFPDKNPFWKLIGSPVAILPQARPQASGTLFRRIEDAIGGGHIGGVIVPPTGDPQIVIQGHCFSVNEDLLISDSEGALRPMVSEHKVRITGITAAALSLEVTPLSGESNEVPENVTLRYDDFFYFD